MDLPINGDKYVRTLSHYLRSNQRRLLLPTQSPFPEAVTDGITAASRVGSGNIVANARSFVTPADSMAAAYEGMVSFWNATTAAVGSITPASLSIDPGRPSENTYNGSWDGTGSILPTTSPSESRLYLQAQLRTPIFPLDLYYLYYLLERFEQVGIELDGWEGTTSRAVGDSTPRVAPPSSTMGPPAMVQGGNSTRPPSIRSFASTAVSTLTLITGWRQWSTAAALNSNNLSITDEIHFIHKVFKHIPSLRLVSKIPPGKHNQEKGRIEDYDGDAILTLFNQGQQQEGESSSNGHPHLLPLAATFSVLTHLELHRIPPACIDGWETLMKQLKSLVITQSGIEDVHDVIVTAVVKSERRRRQRTLREKVRAVQIKEEKREALKDAASLTSQEAEGAVTAERSNGTSGSQKDGTEDDATILASLQMWPSLRHLSMSDNSFPSLAHADTFMSTHSVVSLDLSHNLLISPPHGLIHLHNLNELNLSFNMIAGVQTIYQHLGNISVLDLRGNRLKSLAGLERLWNLEKIDVRENFLHEAAEVGRLAALPGIREVWSERNPFCTIQSRHRLEILAVFKANGHDVLLDGTFASFTEKIALANLSPSSFSTSISGINNVANIPAASAPVATFAQTHFHSPSVAEESLNATTKTTPGSDPNKPVKLVKKKLVKSNKRVKRVVNLDSDHEEDHEALAPSPDVDMKDPDELQDNEVATIMSKMSEQARGTGEGPAKKKKKKTKKTNGKALSDQQGEASTSTGMDGQTEEPKKSKRPKKRLAEMKDGDANANHSTDDDHDPNVDHSLCRGGRHVHKHRLAHLERAMTTLQLERSQTSAHQRHPSRGLKKAPTMPVGAISPKRPSSPIGSWSSDEAGMGGYKRKIEAMRNEAGNNWLMVLAEMDRDSTAGGSSGM
ncbi:MAG: hypothetical protein J3Q66DRAFT_338817 [Benniella sp.]|nr:MAG: hypothetical protein J3Q66DRAFT_338817 [Benniella sp.]